MTSDEPGDNSIGGSPAAPVVAFGRQGYYPGRAVVDLDAIAANVAQLKRMAAAGAGSDCRSAGGPAVMGIVKADGYGHGLLPSALACLSGGATWLGAAQLGEALTLRQKLAACDGATTLSGTPPHVLAWIYSRQAPFAEAIAHGIDMGVSAPWALRDIAAAANQVGQPARLHLKIDTGMGRAGQTREGWADFVDEALRLEAAGDVRVVGCWSHFALAEDLDHPSVAKQLDVFQEACASAEAKGAHFEVRHIANSAATVLNPAAYFDMIRPGLAVYGLSPVPEIDGPERWGLRPAMTIEASLSLVKNVRAGQGVSYGLTYTTQEDTTLAVVPLGYSDGVPRAASNCGPVQIGGQRNHVVGRVCMDQFVVDLGPQRALSSGGGGPIAAGDQVVIFGDGATGAPTVQDWADAAGTISDEIVARVGWRLPRVYIGEVARRWEGVI